MVDAVVESRLTAKQEGFARDVANGLPLADAYRRNYEASGMMNSTIWQEASRLMENPKVTRRVNALAEAREKALLLTDLKRIRVHVMEGLIAESKNSNSQASARIRAYELLGKQVGMFKDRLEIEDGSKSATELEAELQARLAEYFDNMKDITPNEGRKETDNTGIVSETDVPGQDAG